MNIFLEKPLSFHAEGLFGVGDILAHSDDINLPDG
jgi:hypothetical protein